MERINQRENHLVGDNIRRIRLEKGLRNRDVVAKLQVLGVDITAGRLSKMELGLNNPSVDLLRGLTHIYGCDYNAFFDEKMGKKKQKTGLAKRKRAK